MLAKYQKIILFLLDLQRHEPKVSKLGNLNFLFIVRLFRIYILGTHILFNSFVELIQVQ